jgi:DNA-binding protein HU-beta
MNKSEIIEFVAEKADLSKADAERAINAVTECVTVTLKKGEKFVLVGFGTFQITHRKARVGRNPQTGEAINIAASDAPVFKAGKALKSAVNS